MLYLPFNTPHGRHAKIGQVQTFFNGLLGNNVSVCVRYLAAWLGGNGSVPICNLMEDAVTAEIARSQLWQWVHHGSSTSDGAVVTMERVRQMIANELGVVRGEIGETGLQQQPFRTAAAMLDKLTVDSPMAPFLTSVAYATLEQVAEEPARRLHDSV